MPQTLGLALGLCEHVAGDSGGGGGGGSYTASAVTLNGTQHIELASLTATDSFFFGVSFWFHSINEADSPTYWGINAAANLDSYTGKDSHGHFDTELGLVNDTSFLQFNEMSFTPDSSWHHLFIAANTNFGVAAKQYKMLIDGVDVTSPHIDTSAAFKMALSGQAFTFSDALNSNGITGDVADFWMGNATNLLLAGGTVDPTQLAKFRNATTGKPMNPTGFPPALILFSGDKDHFGINQGTGGTVTLNGTLANAASSPST